MTQGFYDGLAPYYHLLYPNWEASIRRQSLGLARVLAEFGVPSGSAVLDAACGVGTQALGLAELGYSVTASDLSPVAITRARADSPSADACLSRAVFASFPYGTTPRSNGRLRTILQRSSSYSWARGSRPCLAATSFSSSLCSSRSMRLLVDPRSNLENASLPSRSRISMTVSPTATNAPEAFGSSLPRGIERDNLERARQYLAAIEGGTTTGSPFAFLAPDICQIEYPNQFVPKGAERDLAAMTDAAERGRRVLHSQRYEVRTAVANGEEVALEVLWVGILAVAVGSLAVGDEMRANFGVFLSFRDGLITRQRNYDCFEPF